MRVRFLILSILFIVLSFPSLVDADVIVSEIAWMGTAVSANDEWVELHNTGALSVSLTGWSLNADDGTPAISLSGSIAAGAYVLLERTDDSSEPTHPALVIFTGALGNEGEDLTLRDNSSTVVQSLNFGSGWAAGDATSRQTMQWTGSAWVTGAATPGAANVSSGTEGNENENEPADEEEEIEVLTTTSGTTEAPRYTKMLTEIVVEDTSVPVGSPVLFSLKTRNLNGNEFIRGRFFWNMGDGTERFYTMNKEFTHTYDYEGTYVVTVEYYKTDFEGNPPDATDKLAITITEAGIVISRVHPDGGVELKNTSQQEIELSGWILRDTQGKEFVLPQSTFIMPNKTLTISGKRTKIRQGTVSLFDPSGGLVSTFGGPPSTTSSRTSASSSSSSLKQTSVKTEQETEVVNLNDRLQAQTKSARDRVPIWFILFGVLLVGIAGFVFYLFKKQPEEKLPTTEEDDFQLLE